MNDSHYISEAGLQKLRDELTYREKELRPIISEKIGTAKEQGDLSENFEYQESKEQQAQNEARIIDLRDSISRAILTEKEVGGDHITINSNFSVETSDGLKKDFTLVGSTEADPMAGKISNDSPLGRNFFGKKVGDSVTITVPSGAITYKITKLD